MRRIATAAQFEHVLIEPTSSLHFAHAREGNGYAMRLHYHPEIELTLILKGHGMRFVGDSVLPFAEGDLCLLGANLLHTWYTGQTPQPTECIVIQFHPDLVARMGQMWPELRRLSPMAARCAPGLSFRGAARKRATALLMDMAQSPAGSAARVGLFLQALEVLHHARDAQPLSSSAPPPQQTDPTLGRFQRIMDTLHRQMPHPPPQSAMADLAQMTPAGFSRFFRRMVGRGYVDYVNAWRIGLACRQLLQTDLPVTQIAFDCGFENLSNFNRRFQQYKQTTPRAYRRLAHA